MLKFEIDALQEYAEANPHLAHSVFEEEQVLDVCLLRVEEGVLMHVISHLGHVYSLLIVP